MEFGTFLGVGLLLFCMLELSVEPGITRDGRVAVYMAVENTSDEDVSIAGARPSFNPAVVDSEGYNYAPSLGYTAVVKHLSIPAGGAYVTRQVYDTVGEVREQWEDIDTDYDGLTIVFDPRDADSVDGSVEVHTGINPEWGRSFTVEFTISYDGREYVEEASFTPSELSRVSLSEFKSGFDTSGAGFQ